MKDDKYFLKEAIKVGNKKAKPYNFGAVIVQNGKIIAADHNHVFELQDPAAHDGISAIRKAAKKLKTLNFDDCVLYCSHEPCFMCVGAAAWVKIERIVYSNPAKENKDFVYHSEELSIEDFAKKLPRPMKVELVHL